MRFSIITINYNNCPGLDKTIRSVITQTAFDSIEYIIIDGGSTDGSKDLIQNNNPYLSYWVSERDGGIYNAMNKGVAKASGDLLLFLNSGDSLASPSVISEVSDYVNSIGEFDKNNTILIGNVNLRDGDNRIIGVRGAGEFLRSPYLMLINSCPHQSTFISRELMISNPYDEKVKIISDWKFLLETVTFGNANVIHVPFVISDYDTTGISSNSYSDQLKDKESILLSMLPECVANDYKKVTGLKSEYYKLKWINSHNWFKKMLFALVGLIMKFDRKK